VSTHHNGLSSVLQFHLDILHLLFSFFLFELIQLFGHKQMVMGRSIDGGSFGLLPHGYLNKPKKSAVQSGMGPKPS
jgi:hypothetical protein